MSSAKGIGPVPEGLEPRVDDFLQQVRLRLISIQADKIATLLGGASTGGTGVGPPGPAGPPGGDPTPDLTAPPTPSGVVVSAGLDFVFISTDAPVFTMGHGYGRTVVYGAKYPGTGPLPTFSSAVIVHEFVGRVGSFGSEPATQWHIWVKWRTNDGVESVSPAGGANGFQVTTGVDVSQLLLALTGSIRQTELFSSLSTRINLIDGAAGLTGSVNARIATETSARQTAISSVATSVSIVDARLNVGGDSYTAIVAAQTTASTKSATFVQGSAPTATRINDSWIDTANGRILKRWDGAAWVVSDDQRIGTSASSITTLQSQIAGGTGSGLLSQVQTEASTRASETGYLSAQYSVRVAVTNGGRTVAGGFGISGTSGGSAGPTIDFGVVADRFYIGAPTSATGVADVLPFIVQATDTTINGVAVLKGVYMDTAFIRNGTITDVKIGNAVITDAKIATVSATKLLAGSIGVGEYIQSTGYVSGVSGWRISGNAALEMNSGTFRGALAAATGTFAGSLTAASGSFSSSASGKRITLNESGSNEGRFYGDRGDGTIELLTSIGVNSSGAGFSIGKFGSINSSRNGVYAESSTGVAIQGSSASNIGVLGTSNSTEGVVGTSLSWIGVRGASSTSIGVSGASTSSDGAYGATSGSFGVAGVHGASLAGTASGVWGVSSSGYGVHGSSTSGGGVYGESASGYGVRAHGNATKAPLFLLPVATAPANAELGGVAVITGTAYGIQLCYADGAVWRRVGDAGVWNAP